MLFILLHSWWFFIYLQKLWVPMEVGEEGLHHRTPEREAKRNHSEGTQDKQVDDQIQVKSCAGLASDNHDDKLDAMPYHALV